MESIWESLRISKPLTRIVYEYLFTFKSLNHNTFIDLMIPLDKLIRESELLKHTDPEYGSTLDSFDNWIANPSLELIDLIKYYISNLQSSEFAKVCLYLRCYIEDNILLLFSEYVVSYNPSISE